MRHSIVVIDTTRCLILFPHLTMQVKNAASELSAKPQVVLTDDRLTIPWRYHQRQRKLSQELLITHLNWIEQELRPFNKFRNIASLLISHSMSLIIVKKVAVRVTNTTELPQIIEKNKQIAKFSVVIPEQSKFIKQLDIAILSMTPEADPDFTSCLNELSQQTNQSSKTLPSGFQHLKIRVKLRITAENRHKSRKNWLN